MTSNVNGLTRSEVQERISQGHTNRVEKFTTRTVPAILVNNIFTVFNGVILISVIILFIIKSNVDAVFLIGVTFGNMALGIFEELRAKWALDRIALLQHRKVCVIREGREEEIDFEEIVQDDLVLLKQGDQIAADGVLQSNSPISIDESSLTGEQDPVEKHRGGSILSGCFCVSGSGQYKVTHVGKFSSANKITEQARRYSYTKTPLQKEINRLIEYFTGIMLLFVFLLLIAHFGKNASISESVLSIVTIIKSLVPEGLVLISTLALALGAYRAAKDFVLVQKINSIESMSHLTTLCLDKTGTLGTSELQFEFLKVFSHTEEEVIQKLKLYLGAIEDKNPTTLALDKKFPGSKVKGIQKLPFSSARKLSAVTIQEGGSTLSLWLGAPEAITQELTEEEGTTLKNLRGQGYRVLLFASSIHPVPQMDDLTRLAFVVLRDELRPDLKEAIRFYESRNVHLKILSGDHPDTVLALAKQAGIAVKGKTVHGRDLEHHSQKDFDTMVREGQFFGGLVPRQKEKIIKSLQTQGEFVGMVGDGVNDIFALKQANIGVAMNAGVPAARDVADIILLKNAFTHLPSLSEEGDRIIYNIKRIARLFITKNIYCIFFILFVGFVGLKFPLSPRFITWIDLLTIGIPTTILTLMTPIILKQSIKNFMKDVLKYALAAGLSIAFFSLLVDANYSLFQNRSEAYGKTASIVVIILMSLYVVFDVSSVELKKKQNRRVRWIVWAILVGAFLLLLPSIYWSPLSNLLGMVALDRDTWVVISLASLLGILLFHFLQKRLKSRPKNFPDKISHG